MEGAERRETEHWSPLVKLRPTVDPARHTLRVSHRRRLCQRTHSTTRDRELLYGGGAMKSGSFSQ
jgi:hypothetical protein